MKAIAKLLELASALDDAGLHVEADCVDDLVRYAFRGQYAKNIMNRVPLSEWSKDDLHAAMQNAHNDVQLWSRYFGGLVSAETVRDKLDEVMPRAGLFASMEREAKEPDKPEKVTEIADAIRRDNPDFSDEKSFRMAWETYCSYVNPGYEGCTSKGKSKRKSPKSDYSDD